MLINESNYVSNKLLTVHNSPAIMTFYCCEDVVVSVSLSTESDNTNIAQYPIHLA